MSLANQPSRLFGAIIRHPRIVLTVALLLVALSIVGDKRWDVVKLAN